MNKKHVSKVGKYIGMACLLFVCAMVQSCRDEYFYDDREPDFIGSSIYDYLDGEGNFTYFLKVINDLGYKDVLQRTGSKTLFVADDVAFMKGIKEEWGFDEYGQLTAAHKRMILYGAMLDNAYLLEMLSKMQSTGVNAEPIPGQCLRQVTSASVTDTIGLFSNREFPKNNPDWDTLRDKRIRLALDATQPMMLHFIEDQLYQKNINEKDLRLLVGNDTAQISDIYVYDKRVIKAKSDVTCKNGYVHQLDGLLISPSNMAEEIRLNGNEAVLEDGTIDVSKLSATSTQLFSRLLDRFAVPVPIDEDGDLAQSFNRLYNQDRPAEKLYEKRYFTEGSVRGSAGNFLSYTDEDGNKHDALGALSFDPGWNAYKAGTTEGVKKEHDMAAIFAPSDVAVIKYFTEEAGRTLIQRYGSSVPDNDRIEGGLLEAIDSIPLSVIEPLVRNHMQMSFNASVPSKFENIMDDARDLMGVKTEDMAIENNEEKVILANNGVVYVMNTLYNPARYRSVIAPIMLNDTLAIFYKYINDLSYDKYLLSMGNKFSMIVFSDNQMIYYDPKDEKIKNDGTPALEAGKKPKGYKFVATRDAEGQLAVVAKEITYDKSSYVKATNTYATIEKTDRTGNVSDLFKEIMEYNIVVGDMNSDKDRQERRKYYMSKGYGTVMVERDATNGYVCGIAGGRERENDAMVPVEVATPMDNGYAIQLKGSLIQPPTQSVYNVLYKTEEFNEFWSLCIPEADVLKSFLGEEEKNQKEWNKYRVFDDILVRMFDTYHYTVYVPTKEALEEAYAQGLPTWQDLKEQVEAHDGVLTDSMKNVMRTSADLITKFVRYHFQDNSVYVDNPKHSLAVDKGDINNDGIRDYDYESQVRYETSALNDSTNGFSTVLVQTDEVKKTIAVCGDFGEKNDAPLSEFKNVCYVINDDMTKENKLFNVMTRDIIFSSSTSSKISTSSYGVVHLIDNFLVYGGKGGIYDAENKKFIR